MGLFDFFKSSGALSQSNAMGPPTYEEMMKQKTDLRNMDTGMKLMLLGRAFKGENVGDDMIQYQQGIRDRFRQRQQDLMNKRINESNLRSADQTYNQNEVMNPLLANAQTIANTGGELANTQSTAMNPMLLEQQRLNNVGTGYNNVQTAQNIALNRDLNPLTVRAQELQNTAAGITNDRNQQLIDQANVDGLNYIGNSKTGILAMRDPNTGAVTDVTSQYSPQVLAAYKAKALGEVKPGADFIPALGRSLTPGEKQRDKTFSKNIEGFNAASSSANIETLSMIADRLATQDPSDGDTGLSFWSPISSFARAIDRDGDMGLRSMMDSQSLDTQQIVAGVIQKNLRETLGAQFTQREGMMLIERAYNPTLSPQMNSRRLKAAAMVAEAYLRAQSAKLDYFNTTGTIANYDADIENQLVQAENQLRAIYAETEGGAGAGAGAVLSPEGQSVYDIYAPNK